MKMKEGIIYKATNTINGQVYIGATKKKLDDRKQDHINKALKGYSGYFQKALIEYGVNSFEWEQIDTAENKNELAQKETEYIISFNSIENGYNSDNGGGFKKTVYQYNIETGKLINSYDDLSSAANAVNAVKTSISSACLHYNKTCKGYTWSYSSTLEPSSSLDLRKKTVNQISLKGEFIACYVSASEASRKTGISKTCITRCCRKERKQSGGFLWEYS